MSNEYYVNIAYARKDLKIYLLSETCIANYSGSSGGMEVEEVVNMFKKSEEMNGIKYNYYLANEDSASYLRGFAEMPYGPDFLIEKQECVGHIQNIWAVGLGFEP